MSLTNDLMDFRLAYLRFIARTWRDDNFFAQFKNKYRCKGKSDLYDLKEALANHFDYQNQWKIDINLRIIDNPPAKGYFMTETKTWKGPDDVFTINIPVWPHDVDLKGFDLNSQKAEALAAYYEKFPTIFGRNPGSQGIRMEGPHDTDLGIGDGSHFTDFGAVIQRIITFAWMDSPAMEEFRTKIFDGEQTDKTKVLSEFLGFNNPWNFEIHFNPMVIKIRENSTPKPFVSSSENAPGFVWIPGKSADEGDSGENGSWQDPMPKNSIYLNYPTRPDKDCDLTLALHEYNCCGPEYPFTCAT